MKLKIDRDVEDTLLLMEIIGQTDEFGDCLLWNGHTNGNGHPKIYRQSGRRMVWQADQGAIPDGLLITTTCGHPHCLAHLKTTTKAAVSRKAMANAVTLLKRRAAGARANRARFGKLTMALAQEIRDSAEPGRVWAKRLQVSDSLISKLRTGQTWVEHVGNPFAGLFRQ